MRLPAGYAWLVVKLRVPIMLAWVVAVAWASQQPELSLRRHGVSLRDLAPVELPAVQAELRASQAFQLPLQSRTLVVQHASDGLSRDAQMRVIERAIALNRQEHPLQKGGSSLILGAVPVINTGGLYPGSRDSDNTAITYLLFNPALGPLARTRDALALAETIPDSHGEIAVTGAMPARIASADILLDALPRLEAVTAIAIIFIVVLFYRSLLAPVIVLAAIVAAYSTSRVALSHFASITNTDMPREVEPLLVALLLGVVTDYSLFFLSAMRGKLREGLEPLNAARQAIAVNVPIVFTAGLTVGVGGLSLVVAESRFISAFGPALAVSVGAALLVSLTLVPALVALFGRATYWPSRHIRAPAEGRSRPTRRFRLPRVRVVPLLTRRRVAIPVAVLITSVLCIAGSHAAQLRLGYDVISSLPDASGPARGQQLASQGFAPGIIAPTVVLVEGSGLTEKLDELTVFQSSIARQDGVAGALGPGTVGTIDALRGRDADIEQAVELSRERLSDPLGVVVTRDGSAARLLVLLSGDPYGGLAVQDLRALSGRLSQLADDAGLGDVSVSLGGDTAVVAEVVERLKHDMLNVTLIVLAIDVVLLVFFLRALIAPLMIIGGSVLALVASLGVTTFVFQDLLGDSGVAFYVPLAVLVLLLSLGADYGIFAVGHVWAHGRTKPLSDAIVSSSAQTSPTIALAGFVLAASFGLLAVVPVHAFLQFAVAMSVGVLLDTFVVRPILLPALLVAFGRISAWPNRHVWAAPRRQV